MRYFLTFVNIISNWFTLFCLTMLAWALCTDTSPYINIGLVTTGIVVFFMLLSQTTAGAKFILLFESTRPLTTKEKDRLEPIIKEITQKAKTTTPELLIMDNMDPNAFVIGNYIILTRGILFRANDSELAGVMAHELGHIVNGDSALNVMNNMINKIGDAGLTLLFALTLTITNNTVRLFMLPFICFAVALKILRAVISGVSFFGLMSNSRASEYRADQYAKKLGYEKELCSFLEKVEPDSVVKTKSIFASHPPIALRIDKLQAA